MHEFPSPKDRLRRILDASPLDGSTYVDAANEGEGAHLLLRARTSAGKPVAFRFRGLRQSDTSSQPAPGSTLRLKKVGGGNKFSLLGTLLPILRILRAPGPSYGRVRIEAGDALLDIVCQDVEWWEEDVSQG